MKYECDENDAEMMIMTMVWSGNLCIGYRSPLDAKNSP